MPTPPTAEQVITDLEQDPESPAKMWAASQIVDYAPEYAERVRQVQRTVLQRHAAVAQAWCAGEDPELPPNFPVLLRLTLDRQRVQTSAGEFVPIGVCERVWALVCKTRDEYRQTFVPELPLGERAITKYPLQSVLFDGAIQVGCHTIPYESIAHIADQLGYPPVD